MDQHDNDGGNAELWAIGLCEEPNRFIGQIEPKIEKNIDETYAEEIMPEETFNDRYIEEIDPKFEVTFEDSEDREIEVKTEEIFETLVGHIKVKTEEIFEDQSAQLIEAKTEKTEVTDWSVDPQSSLDSTFICDHCKEIFRSKYALGGHMTSRHDSTKSNIVIVDSLSLKCAGCDFVGSSKEDLTRHAVLHGSSIQNREFKCKVCDFISSHQGHLKRHAKTHADVSPTELKPHKKGFGFKCQICGFTSSTKYYLDKHSKAHAQTHGVKCERCGVKCIGDHKCLGKSSRRAEETSGAKTYSKCHHCEYTSTSSKDFAVHSKTHVGHKPFKCQLCDVEFTFIGNLQRHIKIHTVDKRFKCDFCDYKCYTSSHLKNHERKHTGEKPYKCTICNFKCKSGSILKQHTKVHCDEKPYACPHCDFKFKAKFNLKQHLRRHTGEKPFKCKFCDHSSRSNSNLKKHTQIFHS